MGIREYDYEDNPPIKDILTPQQNIPNELIIKHEYDMCIKCIMSMFCLISLILVIGFIVLIYVLLK